jgi:hypothetical protein
LEFAGLVNILDGNFVFDKFAYPLRNATGQIKFGYDERFGYETVRILDIQGHGVRGGPNENAIVHLSGLVGPLTSEVGVRLNIAAQNIRDEPTLRVAFPEEVRKAWRTWTPTAKASTRSSSAASSAA